MEKVKRIRRAEGYPLVIFLDICMLANLPRQTIRRRREAHLNPSEARCTWLSPKTRCPPDGDGRESSDLEMEKDSRGLHQRKPAPRPDPMAIPDDALVPE